MSEKLEYNEIRDPEGNLLGIIDRRYESRLHYGEDACIIVTLPCGHQEIFFILNLSDYIYVEWTICLKNKK